MVGDVAVGLKASRGGWGECRAASRASPAFPLISGSGSVYQLGSLNLNLNLNLNRPCSVNGTIGIRIKTRREIHRSPTTRECTLRRFWV